MQGEATEHFCCAFSKRYLPAGNMLESVNISKFV